MTSARVCFVIHARQVALVSDENTRNIEALSEVLDYYSPGAIFEKHLKAE